MNIARVAPRGYFFAGFALALTACSGEEPRTDVVQTGSVEEPIIGGTQPSAGTATSQGFVAIHRSSDLCSGTMLRPDVAITAKHCTTTNLTVDGPPDDNMTHYQLVMDPAGGSTCPNPPGACQARVPSYIYRSLTADVALIQLSDFMAFNSNQNRYDFNRLIYSGTDESLVSASLQCSGYGFNTITRCKPTPVTGGGLGTLRTADMILSGSQTSTSGPALIFFTNTSGPLAFAGDSGSTCIFGGKITGIMSTFQCSQNPLQVTNSTYTAPSAYRDWVTSELDYTGTAAIHTVSSGNVSGSRTTLSDIRLNAKPDAFLYVTANFNPGGGPGFYNDAQLGVVYNSSINRWQIFNENGAAMPVGAKFNYWVPNADGSFVHTVTAASIPPGAPNASRLNFITDPNPNLRPIVQQREVTNNRAVGVWFDTASQRWYVYNEDGSPMTVGATFNVLHASTLFGGFTHTSSSANIPPNSNWTVIDNPNLNNQPTAQFVISHAFNLSGGNSGTRHNKALGVWFDGTHWAIFNQDQSVMPANLTFFIQPRP